MLSSAMDSFQVAKREHKENVKAQYTDMTGSNNGAKKFFRASELGSDDRKIVYSFFGHHLPKVGKAAKNLRQLENGDFVHERFQRAWEEMGVLVSMERRLSSKNDEYLKEFPWEWAGHYDGELDLNIIRAHATGKAKVESVRNEDTGEWEIVVDLDPEYGQQIGLFSIEGGVVTPLDTYQPRTMVADIKTMNPYGFKDIKNKRDVSKITGYVDQISFYMYMLGTPYGSIYIESKDNNDTVEVQILWTDFYDGVELDWETELHGEMAPDVVRIKIDSGRFYGDDTREGVVPRISRLWNVVEELQKADAEGDLAAIARLVPDRCSDKPDGFPCSWGHRDNQPQYCEYYDHCWNPQTNGLAVRPAAAWVACPEALIWSFEDDNAGQVSLIRIDSRKVPKGVDQDGFLQLVDIGALDYTKFLVDEAPEAGADLSPSAQATLTASEAEKTAMNGAKDMFTATGELILGAPTPAAEAEERIVDGQKAITCTNCKKEVTYQKLGPGLTKKCTFCGHVNKVIKL